GYPGKELKHGKLHDDSWSGLFHQIRGCNNDKTTLAGKGILLAMCHLGLVLCLGGTGPGSTMGHLLVGVHP
ncbi:hypothetical protein, partial [Pseudomonas aeruginosa]|uniref:hypothetical protein n=1 Tax=Pseudomonas aeruginosa TaxID=287 RepID=UPI001C5534C8